MNGSVLTGDAALSAGREWLATLPRAAIAHAERGDAPLATVEQLLQALGNPHERLSVIHIAGSKGKGSTALYTETLLRACGRRTFTFTSPHLERWTERLRIDGEEVSAERGLQALRAVQRAQRHTGIMPGFFEALTVAGLWLAAECGADWAVIEAGVGGRADATNVVRPRACVITGIELEHTDRLGTTLEAITREKAGIVKPGAPLIAPLLPAALDIMLAQAAERACTDFVRLRRRARRARADDSDKVTWHYDGHLLSVSGAGWTVRSRLASVGEPMAANAALALATIARLGIVPREGLQQAARSLAGQVLPGRMELLSELPHVMVDGAHTRASAEALASAIRQLQPRRVHLLLSLSTGKDVAAVLEPLLPLASAITVTQADPDWSLAADALAAEIRRHAGVPPLRVEPDPAAALAHACNDLPGETLVLATGSVYLAGCIRGLLRAGGR